MGARVSLLVAVVAGVAAVLLAGAAGFPSTSPACWDDLAAAARLRPSLVFTGGLVRAVYAAFFACFRPDTALEAVRVAGWAAFGAVAFLTCQVLALLCGGWIEAFCRTWRGSVVAGLSLLTATLAFVCSDPVWYALQGLGAEGLQILLALLGTWFQLLFVVRLRRRYAVVAMFAWAIVAGDSPWGLLGALSVPVTVFFACRKASADEPLSNPLARMVLNRVLSAVSLATFGAVVALECVWLRTFGLEEPALADLFGYIANMAAVARDAIPWKTAVLAVPVVLVPAAVTRILRDQSLNDEKFMPVNIAVAHVAIGILAWTQLAGAKGLWFVNWVPGACPASAFVHAALVFVSALTLTWTLLVLGAAAFLKKARKIASFRHADAAESPEGVRMLAFMIRTRQVVLPLVACVPLVILLSVVPFRYESTLLGMLGVIGDSLVQTVDECRGRTRVFTNGVLDAGLELEALRRGAPLYAVSLLAGNAPADLALRNRGLTREEDLEASARGPVNLLRTWVNDTPARLSDAAVQLAFELWNGNTNQPAYLATVALPPGGAGTPDPVTCSHRAHTFAERIFALYGRGRPDRAGTPFLRTLFRDVQWRLSRLAAMRAEAKGRSTWGADAAYEQSLSEKLRDLNAAARDLDVRLARIGERNAAMLTPREGLKLGLDRADFKLASLFASTIILSEPDHPEANFAIGMDHFLSGQYARAEPHLKRCLAHRPHDPAVLNNLAVVELRLHRWEEAERYANEALARMPKAVQIQRTLAAIRKARARATGRPE